jgi:carboxypeptidase Q
MQRLKYLRAAFALLFVFSIASADVVAQTVTADVQSQIREEALERSRVMEWLHQLTDRYGPRLTGSPNLEASGEWALETMTSWGFQNATKDDWEWGNQGWENTYYSGHMVAPVYQTLYAEVLGWTPSTNGPARGSAVHIVPPSNVTQEQLDEYINSIRGDLAGSIVLVGESGARPANFDAPRRIADEDAAERFRPGAEDQERPYTPPTPREDGVLSPFQVRGQVDSAIMESGALVVVQPSGMERGLIRAFANRTYDADQALPTVILRTEDYNRIARLLESGNDVEMEFDIRNNIYPERTTEYNYTAEIPGTDLAHEVIIIGGHLDSWHAGTGATDNAAGVSVMMDAARIIHELGLQPRRTIRLAFWTGEEQGLLGSRAYVDKHFGTFENPKPGFDNVVAYFNLDSGTGRIRGATVFGPTEAAEVLHEILQPLSDLGVAGARETASRRLGGSDHTAFNQAGLPGVSLGQDPIEYFTVTWHTNFDVYDTILEDDMRQAVAVVATLVYELAQRDEMLPRFADEDMPARP